jgi:hypothetical protein
MDVSGQKIIGLSRGTIHILTSLRFAGFWDESNDAREQLFRHVAYVLDEAEFLRHIDAHMVFRSYVSVRNEVYEWI